MESSIPQKGEGKSKEPALSIIKKNTNNSQPDLPGHFSDGRAAPALGLVMNLRQSLSRCYDEMSARHSPQVTGQRLQWLVSSKKHACLPGSESVCMGQYSADVWAVVSECRYALYYWATTKQNLVSF